MADQKGLMSAFRKFDIDAVRTCASRASCATDQRLPDEALIARWINNYTPDHVDADRCAHCRKPLGRIGEDAVPFLCGRGHVWLHHDCHPGWMLTLRSAAERALGSQVA